MPFLVAWGSADFERAKRTSRDMVAALTKAGAVTRDMEIPGADHFQMSLDLGDAAHPWTRTVRAWLASGQPA
jgi:hypothetical protein